MADTLETQLYNALGRISSSTTVKELIKKDVDCNLSHFDPITKTFISPIRLAAKIDRHETLRLLYEHRNSPTKIQLEKHLTFYINHYDRVQKQNNEILFEYTVSRLLYSRITEHKTKTDFNILIAALHDFDNAEHRRQDLSKGLQPETFLQLRIYTLFRKVIDMKTDSNNDMLEIIINELLHNLETYYFLDSIFYIPVVITKQMISRRFSDVKLSLPFLMKYYECIANNVISRIERLEIDEEYTIPTGWIKHAVCVSFRRVTKTHIVIRIDNPSPFYLSDDNEINRSILTDNRVTPIVLGQLHDDNLQDNLNYFVLLIDSVKRDLTLEEGSSLIYNRNRQILHLEEIAIENMPNFIEQANANCFVKCFEPGFWLRIGKTHQELYDHLLILEENNANILKKRCEEESQQYLNNLVDRFNSLAEAVDMTIPPSAERTRLQEKLKAIYKQYYKHLSSDTNIEHCPLLEEKFIPLQFKTDGTLIKLKNLFIKPRVLILGDAGCGKTTVCQYITYLWAQGKLWRKKFEWLFYIKMRNLNSQPYPPQSNEYSLIDIIEREYFEGSKLHDSDKQKLTNLLKTSSNVLWVLDGCDERTIPEYLRFIEKELLTKPNLLLTSRPDPADDLEYDVTIQIQSFTPKDIEDYIHNYFSYTLRTTGNECWLFIKDSSQLKQTACIPACLEIICSLWESGKVRLDIGMTEGELYQKMCDHLLQRYLLKFHRMCNSSLVGRDMYQESNAVAFAHLERLAFEATKSHRLTISGKEITNVAGSQSLSVLQIVLLIPQTRNPPSVLLENVYYFVHRSFQEYLCARYMIRILESSDSVQQKTEVFRFITHEKYSRNAQNTFRLFFEMKRSISCTDDFWSSVDSEPRDLVGLRHCSRIAQWFPNGACIFSFEDEENINRRITDVILAWISNKRRRAHDSGNRYIFDWFHRVIDDRYWCDAWREDLFIEPPSKRRYFLSDLWSTENINAVRNVYDYISQNVEALHRLIIKGPNTISLTHLNLVTSFTLYIIDNQTETLQSIETARELARSHKSMTTLSEFISLLQNYELFANLNRQSMAFGEEIWRLKIDPSALETINDETLHLLLELIQQHTLFFRYFELPVIPFLNLYANQNGLNADICSLIVIITVSSDCILTAPPNQRRLIRVQQNDLFVDIEMDEYRRSSLIEAFDYTREAYGYTSFFEQIERVPNNPAEQVSSESCESLT